jgi:rhodanese-related sulfurtransferase
MLSEFISQNIIWVAIFVLILVLLINSLLQSSVKGASFVSALELPQLQRNGDAQILDVSGTKDFSRAHIPSSVNLDIGDIVKDNKKLKKMRDKTCIVVCQTGSQSTKAARALVDLGFEKVHILRGGLMSWTKENLPTTHD